MDLAHKRRWVLGCLGGIGLLVVIAIALAILDRAMSKGLAPIGAKIPFEAVQINLQSERSPNDSVDIALEPLTLPQKGDRFNLIVQRHAKLVSDKHLQNTPALGYILARQNECLILFSSSTHVKGYQTYSVAAAIASFYYDLRGGLLLLASETEENQGEPSSLSISNENSHHSQLTSPPQLYLLLDSRWCTWLNVHEGMAIVLDAED